MEKHSRATDARCAGTPVTNSTVRRTHVPAGLQYTYICGETPLAPSVTFMRSSSFIEIDGLYVFLTS
jgi:hypothetical protein